MLFGLKKKKEPVQINDATINTIVARLRPSIFENQGKSKTPTRETSCPNVLNIETNDSQLNVEFVSPPKKLIIAAHQGTSWSPMKYLK